MKNFKDMLAEFYDLTACFGSACLTGYTKVFNIFFRKILFHIINPIKKFFAFLFSAAVIIFEPAGADGKEYADDVKKAVKTGVKVLFTRPFTFFPVVVAYIKKAVKKYDFGPKTVLLWLLPVFFAAALFIGIDIFSDKRIALRIDAAGEVIGYVAKESDFISARDIAAGILSGDKKNTGNGLPDITYSLENININDFTDKDSIVRKLLEKSASDLTPACGVYINSNFFAAVFSADKAKNVFEEILAEKRENNKNYIVSFAEDIEYTESLYPPESVLSSEEFKKKLLFGDNKDALYISKKGDTLKDIAEKKELELEELLSFNPKLREDDELAAGTEVVVASASLPLSVKEIKAVVSNETIDFPIKKFQSKALYSGSSRILAKGKKGYAQVTSLVTSIDGNITDTKEFSRLTLQEPAAQIVQVGIRELDKKYSTSMGGILLWPVIGAYGVNSPYGYRWGKIHRGIDIGMGNSPGCSLGKTIVAVAAGRVVTASVHSSYGYYIIIDHGGGMQTVYGHCLANSLLVVPGQEVVAGQPIARVGQTGFATGPHLHFEVRINGNRVNPAPYLGI